MLGLLALTTSIAIATEPVGKELPYGHQDFYPSPERPVGWLGNGSGHFLGAEPPLDVDEYQGKGILWKIPMPAFSQTQPIVVGNRVFTSSEPGTMICVEADTGRILWQDSLAWLEMTDLYKQGFEHYFWGGSWGAPMSDGQFVAHGFRPRIDKKFIDLYPFYPRPLLMVWDTEGRRHWAKGGMGVTASQDGGGFQGVSKDKEKDQETWLRKLGPAFDWLSVANFKDWQILQISQGKILQPVDSGKSGGDRKVHVIAHDLRTGKEVWRGPGFHDQGSDEGMTPLRIGGRDMVIWGDGQILDVSTGKLLGNVFPKGLLPAGGFDYATPVVYPNRPDVVLLGVYCYSMFVKQENGLFALRDFSKKSQAPANMVKGGVAVMPVRIVVEPSGTVHGEPLWKKSGVEMDLIQSSCLGVSDGRVFTMPQRPQDPALLPGAWQTPILEKTFDVSPYRIGRSFGMNMWDADTGAYVGYSLFGGIDPKSIPLETDEQLIEWRTTKERATDVRKFWSKYDYHKPWTDKRGYLWTENYAGWFQVFDKDGKRVAGLKLKFTPSVYSFANAFPHGKRLYVRTWPALYCLSNEEKPKASGPTLTEQIRSAADKVDDTLLMNALASRYQDDRDAAVKVIGTLPSERQTALITKVTPLLNDKQWQTHRAAMQALVAIGVEANTLLPGWFDEARKAMESKDWFQAESLYESCAGIVADGNVDRARRISEELKQGAVEVKLGNKTARFNKFSGALVDFCKGKTDPIITETIRVLPGK